MTTNYGLAGGVCDASVHYAQVHRQMRRQLEQIEQKLVELKKDDPEMYFMGDFDELLDAHRRLTERLKGSIA